MVECEIEEALQVSVEDDIMYIKFRNSVPTMGLPTIVLSAVPELVCVPSEWKLVYSRRTTFWYSDPRRSQGTP